MSERLRVLLLADEPDGEEASAIQGWLEEVGLLAAARPLADPGRPGSDLCDVVWVHATTPFIEPDPAFDALQEPLECGGAVLTGGAAALPFTLGIEPEPPNDVGRTVWRDEEDELFLFDSFAAFPRLRGHAAFRSHPLLQGLGSGVYTWSPRDGEAHTSVAYRAPAWPGRGRVVAVERSFIHVNADRATIWEYDPMEARSGARERRTLCIGAHLPLHGADPVFRERTRRLAWNALHYVACRPVTAPDEVGSGSAIATRHWRRWKAETVEEPFLEVPAAPALEGPLPPLAHALTMAGAPEEDAPFTLAGRRAFLAGGDGRGVDEVWAHPLRIASRPGLAGAVCRSVTVTPAGIERALDVDGRQVAERVLVPRDLPCALMEWTAAADVALEVTWRTDLRLMWPYPPGALGPLRWRRGERSIAVACSADDDIAWFGFSQPPDELVLEDDSGEAPALRVHARFTLGAGTSVRFALVGAPDLGALDRTLKRLRHPAALAQARLGASAMLLEDRLTIEASDPRAGEAVGWAKERLASYLVETPGVGRSLVAGYWGSADGWFNEGRPGYAWYFGRDAVWTALASLAVGDFEAAGDVIRFLGRHQDLSGKILHECTTSGSVHYDAADATPLYLLLVARYFAWTGDANLLRSQWDRVLAAYRFCLATDRDEDGLIENTGVGHGWIEFGPLGGGTVTYYNGAIWTAALGELARAAESLGEAGLAEELGARHETARAALEATFRDPAEGRYAINVKRGSTGWERNLAQTAMQAVPLLLGVADEHAAGPWLDAIASDDFTAPWGVRMLAASDPSYNPESYHGGAIWPLFTGWVAWAEYAAGRGEAGFQHWWMNVEQAWWNERGAWDEVLHGAERRGRGVCPDQAWSAAMVVAPLVYGLLGAMADAPVHRLRLRPQLPERWDRLDVRRLRVGDADISLRYRRNGDRHTYRLSQDRGGTPLNLVLEPVVRAQTVRVEIDGRRAQLDVRPFGRGLLVPVQLTLDADRAVALEAVGHGGDPNEGRVQ